LLHHWYNQLLTSSAFLGLVSFALSATALSAIPLPPKAAGCLVMAVVDTILALVLVVQGAAMVAALVEIAAPATT
jgi:hypothetical protein